VKAIMSSLLGVVRDGRDSSPVVVEVVTKAIAVAAEAEAAVGRACIVSGRASVFREESLD